MALTQVKTTGLADDAVTTDKLANAINTERTANTAKPTLANDANNRVVTGDGSGGLNGEANLTFDGTRLSVGGYDPTSYYCDKFVFKVSDEDGITIASGNNTLDANENNYIMFASTDSGAGRYDGYVRYGHQSHSFLVSVNNGGGSGKNFTFESDGDFKIGDGDLVLGGTGHGINFADSQTNAAGMTSETLDSYEEGTFTPSLSFGQSNTGITYDTAGADTTTGHYTKIGRLVNCSVYIKLTSKGSATGVARVEGLPFTPDTNNAGKGSASIGYFANMDLDAPLTLWTTVNGTSMVVRRIHTNWDYLVNCGEGNFTNTSTLSFSVSYIVP